MNRYDWIVLSITAASIVVGVGSALLGYWWGAQT